MAGRLEGKVAFITGAGSVGSGWGNGVQLLYALLKRVQKYLLRIST